MGTNGLLALRANMVIEADMQDALDDHRGIKRQLVIDIETSGRLEKLSHLRLSSDSLRRVDDGGGDGGTARFL